MSHLAPQADVESIAPVLEQSPALPDAPVKLNGRRCFLHSLQRISSSPSLARFGRSRNSSNPYGGRSSLSCVSLASGSNYDASVFATSPTSGPGTPGVDGFPSDDIQSHVAIRRIERSLWTFITVCRPP